MSLVPLRSVLAVAVAAAVAAGCSHPTHTADYLAAGSHGVGVHSFTFVDTSRATPANGSYAGAPTRTLVVEVWYPASAGSASDGAVTDAPAARGPFPLVLHSHGFMDNRRGQSYLAEHLAGHGFVVAAPDYPLSNGGAPGGATIADTPEQPLDARFVIDNVLAQSADATSPIAGTVDATRIGASGLSLGGLTTLLAGFHPTLRDPRLRAALALAPPSCMLLAPFFATTRLPLAMVQGDADLLVPPEANTERAFPLTEPPSQLVLLRRGSHTAFAGLASLLDPTMNYDRLGCQALGNVSATSFAALGSADQGISQDPSVCPMPCQGTPMDPSLDATRQQDLTRAIGLAFFAANLQGDAEAQSFLTSRLAAENPEVASQSK